MHIEFGIIQSLKVVNHQMVAGGQGGGSYYTVNLYLEHCQSTLDPGATTNRLVTLGGPQSL